MRWKRGISGLAVAGGVIAGVLAGSTGTASAEGLPHVTSESGTSEVANDGCTFSSVGGSCSDPGPVGNAWIAVRNWMVSMGYGSGSSSGTAYFI